MLVAYRLTDKPHLAYCPYDGKLHRVRKSSSIMSHVKCPKSGETYRVVDAVTTRRK